MTTPLQGCHNCKACPGNWVKTHNPGLGKDQYWSECRRSAPKAVSSQYAARINGREIYAAEIIGVPFGYWCADYEPGRDTRAATFEFGSGVTVEKETENG